MVGLTLYPGSLGGGERLRYTVRVCTVVACLFCKLLVFVGQYEGLTCASVDFIVLSVCYTY